jgi:thioredoxin 1
MKKVTDETFEQEVLNSEIPVLVDFFTTWCGPCKLQAPILKDLYGESDTIKVVKFNAEGSEIADEYDVTCVPTLMLFKDGKKIDKREGLQSKKNLEEWLKE